MTDGIMKQQLHISDKDTIFRYFEYNVPEFKNQISFFGWEKDKEHFFFNYIEGYKHAANAVYNEYKAAAYSHDIEIQDTICYPLVFLYRHIVELYLKYMYLALCNVDENKIKSFFKDGHDLKKLWGDLVERLSFLSDRVGICIDIAAIEKYINDISYNDQSSFNFRYPVTKQNDLIHSAPKYLDIDNLNNHMNNFFDYLDYIIRGVEDQWVDDKYEEEFNHIFETELLSTRPYIEKLFMYLDGRNKKHIKEQVTDKVWLSMSDIKERCEEEIEAEHQMIKELSPNQKSLLIIMCWAGRLIKFQNLATLKEERKRDIYKVLFNSSNSDIAFDKKDNSYKNRVIYDCLFGNKHAVEYISNILKELEL